MSAPRKIAFRRIAEAAAQHAETICARWLDGKLEGNEFVALNPRRADSRRGSFKINLRTGFWSDFAVDGARGRDLISLAGYLFDLKQGEAALKIADMLGIDAYE